MDYRDTISAELPPTRDDEPASLRRDIVDELADHLACSYNRELLRGADATEARQRVLHRFGDPAAVAGWLARARTMLAKRLTQRGVALSSGALAAALSQKVVSAGGQLLRPGQKVEVAP